jgi:hypothetical protein
MVGGLAVEEIIGPQVLVRLVAGEDVVGNNQDGVSQGSS